MLSQKVKVDKVFKYLISCKGTVSMTQSGSEVVTESTSYINNALKYLISCKRAVILTQSGSEVVAETTRS